jgi:hypothetical protein
MNMREETSFIDYLTDSISDPGYFSSGSRIRIRNTTHRYSVRPHFNTLPQKEFTILC